MSARQGAVASALFTSPSLVRAGCRTILVLSNNTEEIPSARSLPHWQHPLLRCDLWEGSTAQLHFGQLPMTDCHSTAWHVPSWLLREEEKTQQEKTDKWENERSNIYCRAVRQEVWYTGANGNRVAGKTKHRVQYKHTMMHCRLPCNMVSNSIIYQANNSLVQGTVSITSGFCIQLQKQASKLSGSWQVLHIGFQKEMDQRFINYHLKFLISGNISRLEVKLIFSF